MSIVPYVTFISLAFIAMYFICFCADYVTMKRIINEEELDSYKSIITHISHLSRDKRTIIYLESKMDYLTEKSFILSPDGVAKFLLKNEIAKFVETATKEIARLKS